MSQNSILVSGKCTLCGYCQLICPEKAIQIQDSLKIDVDRCSFCEKCIYICPVTALSSNNSDNIEYSKTTGQRYDVASCDIVVIGSGIGGLLAAAFLCRQGKKVAVLEKLDFFGGRFTGFFYEGNQVGTGALHLAPHGSRGPFGQALRSLDLSVDFVEPDIFAAFWVKGKHFVAHRFWDVFRLLSFHDRLDLAKILLQMKAKKHLPDDVSFAEWLRTQTTSSVLASLFQKFVNFSVSSYMEHVSYNEIRAFFENIKNLGYAALPKGGCKAIIDKLEHSIREHGGVIRTSVMATEIMVEKGRIYGLRTVDRKSGETATLRCRQIVSDIGAKETVALLGNSAYTQSFGDLYNMKVAQGLRIYFASETSLIPHKGIMFCLDTDRICAVTQPTNADTSLATKNTHLLITYQVNKTTNLADELALALRDLGRVFGSDFRRYCHILNIGVFSDGWPVNRALQGTDCIDVSPMPGLYLVGDSCKPQGHIMVEGVAKSVELALVAMEKTE